MSSEAPPCGPDHSLSPDNRRLGTELGLGVTCLVSPSLIVSSFVWVVPWCHFYPLSRSRAEQSSITLTIRGAHMEVLELNSKGSNPWSAK